jgi:hypothetical protein
MPGPVGLHQNLGWYAVNDAGEPECQICGTTAVEVAVVDQKEVGTPPDTQVSEQTYIFGPCGHEQVVALPTPTGI